MTSTISPVGQVRDDAVPVVAAVEAAPVHLRPIGPDAGCAVLTLAVLAVAVTDPGHPAWAGTALALAAVAVGWGGGPAFHSAWAAMRRGAVTVDTLTGVGLLAVAATAVIAALGHPADLGPTVVAAAAATLRCAGGTVEGRLTAADGEARGDGPVERARRGAAVLQRAADRAVGGFASVVVVLAVSTLGFWLGTGAGRTHGTRRRRRGAARRVPARRGPRRGDRAGRGHVAGRRARRLPRRPAERGGAGPGRHRRAVPDRHPDDRRPCAAGGARRRRGRRRRGAAHRRCRRRGGPGGRRGGRCPSGRRRGGRRGAHPVRHAARRRGVRRLPRARGARHRHRAPRLHRCLPDACRPATNRASWRTRPWSAASRCSPRTGSTCPPTSAARWRRSTRAGATAVAVSWDGVARAVLEVADPLRPGVPEAVDGLRALGLRPVVLTGDDEGAARGLATGLAVEEVVAEVRPPTVAAPSPGCARPGAPSPSSVDRATRRPSPRPTSPSAGTARCGSRGPGSLCTTTTR